MSGAREALPRAAAMPRAGGYETGSARRARRPVPREGNYWEANPEPKADPAKARATLSQLLSARKDRPPSQPGSGSPPST